LETDHAVTKTSIATTRTLSVYTNEILKDLMKDVMNE